MLYLTQTIKIIKSITAKEIYRLYPKIQKKLWVSNIWSADYFVSIVERNGNENKIKNYIRNQGKEYIKIYKRQLKFFD